MEKQKKSLFGPMDLTKGTCWKTILIFSLPVILSYLLQQVYSISDAAIVGQTLTAQEVAGVNDTTSLVFIFLQFAFGVSAGFCVVTSCQVGARNQAGVRRSLATQIILSAVLTVLLTALALALLNPMLAWINVTPDNAEVYRAAYTYCFIIFAGIGAQLFYNFICAFLRSMGDSLTPLLFLLFSTVLNVGLDLLFIVTFRMGVMGASVATVAAQLISGLLCLILIIRKYPILKLSAADLLPRRAYLQKLLSMGIPMGLQFSITAIGGTVLQTAVNELGTASMAAMTAGNKISLLFDCPLSAIGTAMATFAGQNLGAHRLDRVHKGFRVCMLIGGIYCIAIFALIVCGGSPLSGIFLENPSEEIISMCEKFLLYNSSLYFLLLMVFLLRMTLQGLGYSFIVVLAGVLEMVARGGIALGLVPQLGFDAVCLANPAAWLFADVFLLPTYLIGVHRLGKQEKAGKLNV